MFCLNQLWLIFNCIHTMNEWYSSAHRKENGWPNSPSRPNSNPEETWERGWGLEWATRGHGHGESHTTREQLTLIWIFCPLSIQNPRTYERQSTDSRPSPITPSQLTRSSPDMIFVLRPCTKFYHLMCIGCHKGRHGSLSPCKVIIVWHPRYVLWSISGVRFAWAVQL